MGNTKFDFFDGIINNIDIEILEHGLFTGDSNWKHFNINSPYNRLYFVLDSEESYVTNSFQRVTLEGGSVYLIPAHSTNNYICNSFIRKFYLHFKAELYSGFDIFENLKGCAAIPYDMDGILRLIEKASSRHIADMISCKSIFLGFISEFIDSMEEELNIQPDREIKNQKLYQFIKNNCNAELTVKEIAKYMRIPMSTLSKNFKANSGYTLKSYIDRKLTEKAKEKLILTDFSIKEIAFQLKFTDEFYFSHFFKRNAGISPKEYRKNQNIMKIESL